MDNFNQIQDAITTVAKAIGNLTLTATRANVELTSVTYRALDAAAKAATAAKEETDKLQQQAASKENTDGETQA